jgi:hypothetical protein
MDKLKELEFLRLAKEFWQYKLIKSFEELRRRIESEKEM